MRLLAVLAAALVLGQPEKITLKFNPRQGDKLTVVEKTAITIDIKAMDQEMTMEQRGSEKKTYEFVEVEGGKVKKVVIDCEEDVEEKKQPPNEDFEKTENPLHGKKVTLSEKDGKRVIEGEGADELPEKVSRKLRLEDTNSFLFPKEAVAVGDSWEVKGDDLKKFVNDDDIKEGTVKLKLSEVKEIGGRKCAVISVKIDMKGKTDNDLDLEVSLEGEMTVWIERGYTLGLKAKGKIGIKGGGEQAQIEGSGPMTVEVTATVK